VIMNNVLASGAGAAAPLAIGTPSLAPRRARAGFSGSGKHRAGTLVSRASSFPSIFEVIALIFEPPDERRKGLLRPCESRRPKALFGHFGSVGPRPRMAPPASGWHNQRMIDQADALITGEGASGFMEAPTAGLAQRGSLTHRRACRPTCYRKRSWGRRSWSTSWGAWGRLWRPTARPTAPLASPGARPGRNLLGIACGARTGLL
jgi:hypothetical protein